jgi:maltokinase
VREFDAARDAVAALDPAAIGVSRWYEGKRPESVELVDALVAPRPILAVVDVVAEGTRARYSLPLDARLWEPLLHVVSAGHVVDGLAGSFVPRPAGLQVPDGDTRPLDPDQTNTSAVIGEQLVAKLYRRLEPGHHPEVDAVSALHVDEVPAFRGTLAYRDATGAESTLLLVQDYVPGAESGWDAYIERLVALCADPAQLRGAVEDAGAFAAAAARVHRALAVALPVTNATAAALAARRESAQLRLMAAAAELGSCIPAGTARRLRNDLATLDEGVGAPLQRVHGDLTVGQFLRRPDGGLSIVDFEGEPGRTLADRAAPWTVAWDLATLLLSYENAAAAARRRVRNRGLSEEPLDAWLAATPARTLEAYGTPVDESLLRGSLAEKQVTELLYAARRLPEWLYAPLEVLGRRWG